MISPGLRPYADTAVASLSETLAGKSRSHADLARAIRCVIVLRNRLIEERRANEGDGECLREVNSLLSLGHGAEFPLIGFHRDRIEKMRNGLQKLLA